MSITLIQSDEFGDYFTSLGQTSEERNYLKWLWDVEQAATGTTIFVHRLSDAGHLLCNVPAAHPELVDLGLYPPRLCGCFDCIDTRTYIRTYGAWTTAPEARELPDWLKREIIEANIPEEARDDLAK